MAPIGLSGQPLATLIYHALVVWLPYAPIAFSASAAEGPTFPGKVWETATPAQAGLDEEMLRRAKEYALTGEGSGVVVCGGRVVLSWGDTRKRYDLKSTTESFGATALGLAIACWWKGLAVYESPKPWGPWTCVYEADPWDVYPGDSASFPVKWLAPDGRGAHLVFAGDDSFSVRRARFVLRDDR